MSRGQQIDEKSLPLGFAWIESDTVTQRADSGDDSGRLVEYHDAAFQVGVISKNGLRFSAMDAAVATIRSRMQPDFEGFDFRLISTDYEEEIRTFGRPFVAAVLNFTVTFTTPEGDAG